VVIAVNLVSDTTFRGTVIHDPLSIEPTLENITSAAPGAGRTLSARIFGGMGGNLRRLFGKREDGAPGIANAMMDAFNIAQGRISRSRLAGDPPDVLINARLGKVGLFDFHRADELIAIGREATRRALPEIADDIAALPRRARSHRAEFCLEHDPRKLQAFWDHALGMGSCGRDIFAQRLMLMFQLLKPIFDHVADRHNSNQSLVDNDREMAAAPNGHFFHGPINAFALLRCHDQRRHML